MKTLIIAVLLLFASVMTSAEPITKLTIKGGSVSMWGSPRVALNPGVFANITVGSYEGGSPISPNPKDNAIAVFDHVFGPGSVFTSDHDDINSGFRPPTGDITNGVATLDLDSWTVWWIGETFNQSSSGQRCATHFDTGELICSTEIVVDSYDAASGWFIASWRAVIVDGSFNAQLGDWIIWGTMFVTPPVACDDKNGDGVLNAADVLLLQRKISGYQ